MHSTTKCVSVPVVVSLLFRSLVTWRCVGRYVGGHSDMLGGIVIGSGRSDAATAFMAKVCLLCCLHIDSARFLRRHATPCVVLQVKALQEMAGAVAAPFDCWLAMRWALWWIPSLFPSTGAGLLNVYLLRLQWAAIHGGSCEAAVRKRNEDCEVPGRACRSRRSVLPRYAPVFGVDLSCHRDATL